ncbi:MAG: hypothetical protein J7J99_05905 [Thermoprotei archaeon]|nr:hypothetical protein [Thermoprotei archaeon]
MRTVCPRDCYDTCFMIAIVRDGRIISMKGDPDNPITQGFPCP